ncbi:Gag-Pol polyprotein [Plakobranchus ocellatus]|uniref:Gag-Pol polyprotein n=1 Tax=Plakobranchus ocellatus TaxID=259542 RepID=A0AAV4ACH0_9GAST|nr:Gag-Pol polyprotein [Plakobranchus ocellatus]
MSTCRHREAARRSRNAGRGHPYLLQALVWALAGSGSEGVGEAVLLADYLLKTEGMRTVVQWIPSNVGVLGNKIADGLANEGRSMSQPRKPLTLSDAMSVLQRGSARQVIIYKVCQGVTLYKSFVQSETHTPPGGLSATRLVRNYCLSSLRGTGRNGYACLVRMPGSGR